MAVVSISEAAKLVGKSVKTLYRHMENGKLSYVMNDNGSKSVDTSELQRAYGNLKLSNDKVINSQMSQVENEMTQQLRQENEHLRELLRAKEQHIESLNKAMLLLEVKKEISSKKSNKWSFKNLFK